MGSKPNTEVTDGAKQIMDYCKTLQVRSGLNAVDFAKKCGMGQNYWYVRARYDAPLTISDCERIAAACGMTLRELFVNALRPDGTDSEQALAELPASDTARAYEARERESQITDDLIDRIAAHPEDYDVAANRDPNKEIEMNGGEGR